MQSTIEIKNREIEAHNGKINELTSTIESLNIKIAKLQSTVEAKDREIKAFNFKINKLTSTFESLNGKIAEFRNGVVENKMWTKTICPPKESFHYRYQSCRQMLLEAEALLKKWNFYF